MGLEADGFLLIVALRLAGCTTNGGYGTGAGTGVEKHGSGAAASAGTASTAGATGTSGSSGASGSSGGSGSSSGTVTATCDAGLLVSWRTADFCKQAPITAPASVTNLEDPAMATSTDSSGSFFFCVAPGSPVVFSISAPGYVTTVSQVIVPEVSEQIPGDPVLWLYCQDVFAKLAADLQTSTPAFDENQSVVAVSVESPPAWFRMGQSRRC